jgi:hypothetical protein
MSFTYFVEHSSTLMRFNVQWDSAAEQKPLSAKTMATTTTLILILTKLDCQRKLEKADKTSQELVVRECCISQKESQCGLGVCPVWNA